jgi:alkylation response protein AidB-like acyl-CoA dehydrogenase
MGLTSDERDELRSAVRSGLGHADVRAITAEPPGYDRSVWNQMVDLGWTTIHVPERFGGGGAGYADAAVVLHELGRTVTPSPFLGAMIASGALSLADDESLAALSGGAIGTVALASTAGSYELSRCTMTWESSGASVRLAGSSGFVLDADVADVVVAAARDRNGTMAAFVIDGSAPGVRVQRTPTVDQTRRLFTVSFDDVVVAPSRMLCEPGPRAEELLTNIHAVGAIAAACDAVGVAERAMEGAAEYAKDRKQFGKPIGTFQAVKHHCANMAIATESSRAATRAAAEALDDDSGAWVTTAAITSSYVGPACSRVCELALLVHGGIGFTSEHDSHLFLKRAKLDEVLFGTPSWHRRLLADAVFPALVS